MKPENNNFEKIPKWNDYYPDLASATREQKKFYNFWLEEFKNGKFIDIENNLSYVFVYLYSVLKQFINDKNIKQLLKCFQDIRRAYGENYVKILDYLTYWTSDAYLYLKNYDKAWELKKDTWEFGKSKNLNMRDFLNFRSECKDQSIDGQDLLRVLGSDNGLSSFGKIHHKQIIDLASLFLKDFHKEHGENFIEYFCRQFDFSNLTEGDIQNLREFYTNEKDFFLWRKVYEDEERKKYPYKYQHILFNGAIGPSAYIECYAVPYIIQVAIENESKRILRECENKLREEKNLPRVGEGWIAEAELFYQLCETFPEEKIVYHGRPAWLSPQHLDIYFPFRNIGVEYQGLQHQSPVEYFGGERAFKKQQERDRRKRRLCKKHRCSLLYVYEESNFEDIKQEIQEIFNNK